MVKYIIDANILIQAYRKHYAMDVFISFWMAIKHLAESNAIISIDKVQGEIVPNKDTLTQWCAQQLPKNFFIDTAPFIREYSNVINHVVGLKKYTSNAISEFSSEDEADAFLVATALSSTTDYIIVTEEVGSQSPNKIKIPDVCLLFGIKCIDTITMFRELKISI